MTDHASHYFLEPFPGAPFKRCTDCPAHEETILAKKPCAGLGKVPR